MQSINASLTWEYFSRNRWLLLTPLLGNIPASFILLPFMGLDTAIAAKELVAIQLILLLCLVLLIGVGVQATQGSLRRFYLKPISTLHLVSFYYWTGAFMVGVQVAAMLGLWRFLTPIDLPIAGPVLFSIVCWGTFQPILRGVLKSLGWIPISMALLSILDFWLLYRYGIPLKRGGMMTPEIHPWNHVSIADLLIAAFALAISFILTLWRVAQDRAGREHGKLSLVERVDQAIEKLQFKLFRKTQRFASSAHSLRWFDFNHRCGSIPAVVASLIIMGWMILGAIAIFSKDPASCLAVAVGFTFLAAILQILYSIIAAIIGRFGHSINQFEVPERIPKEQKVTLFGVSPYLLTLPVSSKSLASAMLRTSFMTCACGTAIVLSSFTIVAMLSAQLGINLSEALTLKIPYWKFSLLTATISLIVSFASSFVAISFLPLLNRFDLWIVLVLVFAVLLALKLPLSISLWVMVFMIVLGLLVYTTIQSLLNNDMSSAKAAIVWGIGLGITTFTLFAIRDQWDTSRVLFACSLIALAMLPYFSTAEGLRRARTS
jgi:hypothetical protein